MIFLSGHGMNTPDQHYRFLPYNFDPDHKERTTISDSDLQQYITKILGQDAALLDTCFSGNVVPGSRSVDSKPDVDKFANELRSAKNGVVVFTSSTGDELSLEPPNLKNPDVRNGAFTWAVLDGLRGAAARQGTSVVSLTDLSSYFSHTVHDLTSGNQHPMMAMPVTVQDYPIASVVR